MTTVRDRVPGTLVNLLLVAGLLSSLPAWVEGTHLLTTYGVDGVAAGTLAGAVAVCRAGLSARLLHKRLLVDAGRMPTPGRSVLASVRARVPSLAGTQDPLARPRSTSASAQGF